MKWVSRVRAPISGRDEKPQRRGAQKILWTGPEGEVAEAERKRLVTAGHAVDTHWVESGGGSEDRLREKLAANAFNTIIAAGDIQLYGDLLRRFDGRVVARYYGEDEGIQHTLWHSLALQRMAANRSAHIVSAVDLGLCPGEPPWITSRTIFLPHAGGLSRLDGVEWRPQAGSEVLVTRPEQPGNPSSERISALADQYFGGSGYAPASVALSGTRGLVVGCADAHANLARMTIAPALLTLFSSANLIPMVVLEMLAIGAPVIYFKGALAPLGLPPGGPGEVRSIEEARAVIARLRGGDVALVEAFAAAQLAAKDRYATAAAGRKFDDQMMTILSGRCDLAEMRASFGGQLPEAGHATRLAYDILDGLERSSLDDGPTARRLVRTLYNIILQREPDSAGLEFHVARLRSSRRFERTVADVLTSEEAQIARSRNSFLAWLNEPADAED